MIDPKRLALRRHSAERLLAGQCDAANPVATLLTAAAAPPADGEFAGENDALAQFRIAIGTT
jgi:hypothetical protein